MKFLYLFKNNLDLIKLGVSSNPEHRLRSISTISGTPLKLINKYPLPEGLEWKVEKAMHLHFKHRNVVGEWFSLSREEQESIPDRLQEILKGLKDETPLGDQTNSPFSKAVRDFYKACLLGATSLQEIQNANQVRESWLTAKLYGAGSLIREFKDEPIQKKLLRHNLISVRSFNSCESLQELINFVLSAIAKLPKNGLVTVPLKHKQQEDRLMLVNTLLDDGLKLQEIADTLGVSLRTVKNLKASLKNIQGI